MFTITQTYKWTDGLDGLDGRLSPAASLLRAPYGANKIHINLTNVCHILYDLLLCWVTKNAVQIVAGRSNIGR